MKKPTLHEQITKANELLEKRQGKTMPHSEESERFVLGCILTDEFYCNVVFENFGMAEGEDVPFYFEKNRVLFDVCRKIFKSKNFPNSVNVNEYVRDHDLREFWSVLEIFDLIPVKISPTFLGQHCRILLQLHARRRFILECEYHALEGYLSEHDLTSLLDSADTAIVEIRTERKQGELKTLDSINVEDQTQFKQGFKTGFQGIDEKTNHGAGAQGGDYILIAARPSLGKTTLATCFMSNELKTGTPILFASLEMNAGKIAGKFFEVLTACPHWKLEEKYINATLTPEEHAGVRWYRDNKDTIQLYIEDSERQSVLSLRGQLSLSIRKYGVKALFVDYLQLLKPVTQYLNTQEREVSETSVFLKSIAREFNVPVFVLSQLNRSSLQRADKKPSLGDLRMSGSLEQDADIVIFLHDPKMATTGNTDEIRDVELIIAKNRLGACGSIYTKFHTQISTFKESFEMPEFEKPNTSYEAKGAWN